MDIRPPSASRAGASARRSSVGRAVIARRLRPQRPAPPTADASCKVCGAWMRLPRAASARERAIAAGFFWAGHQHEALDPIIDEFTWETAPPLA